MENIRIYANLERVIAQHVETEQALGDAAHKILSKARARLERHRKSGAHRITQTKGRIDHFVNLVGPAAMSIEEGHHHARSGEWVEGLRILDGAIGGTE